MALINVTETLVRMVFHDEFLDKKLICTCEQCLADTIALTLNRLPSRYVSTDQGLAYVKTQYFNPQIHTDIIRELTMAASQVASRPHHTMIQSVFNVTETLVRMVFDEEFLAKKIACSCEQCSKDILALTLNQLPSRYVSTDLGQVYVKSQYFDPQLRSDILRELTVAAHTVGLSPHHMNQSVN